MPNLNHPRCIEVIFLQRHGDFFFFTCSLQVTVEISNSLVDSKAKHNTTNRRSPDKASRLICRTGEVEHKGFTCSTGFEKECEDGTSQKRPKRWICDVCSHSLHEGKVAWEKNAQCLLGICFQSLGKSRGRIGASVPSGMLREWCWLAQ